MADESLESALDDLKNILAIVDGAEIDASENPEWSEVEELLGTIRHRANSLLTELESE